MALTDASGASLVLYPFCRLAKGGCVVAERGVEAITRAEMFAAGRIDRASGRVVLARFFGQSAKTSRSEIEKEARHATRQHTPVHFFLSPDNLTVVTAL